MEMPKKKIQKWINALRSGKYKQTRYTLQDEAGFCCLGVLCKTQVPNYSLNERGFLVGILVGILVGGEAWMGYINSDFYNKTGYSLSRLNDKQRLSFDEIADLLESVYILEEGNK